MVKRKIVFISGIACICLAILLFIHHFLICGRWIDLEDILHHEIIELMLLEAGIFLIVMYFTKDL